MARDIPDLAAVFTIGIIDEKGVEGVSGLVSGLATIESDWEIEQTYDLCNEFN